MIDKLLLVVELVLNVLLRAKNQTDGKCGSGGERRKEVWWNEALFEFRQFFIVANMQSRTIINKQSIN